MSQVSQVTCGVLYLRGFQTETNRASGNEFRLFDAGFIYGQAEKIYIGACHAAMYCPAKDNFPGIREVVERAARIYGLKVTQLETKAGVEIWLCGTDVIKRAVEGLHVHAENGENWHLIRGILCGIPTDQIDKQFHLRQGFGEPCDKVGD